MSSHTYSFIPHLYKDTPNTNLDLLFIPRRIGLGYKSETDKFMSVKKEMKRKRDIKVKYKEINEESEEEIKRKYM